MKKFGFIIFAMLLGITQTIGAEDLSLEQFLKFVKSHSKDLKLAGKDRELANAQKKEAFSTAFPKIFAQADYRRNLSDLYMYADLGDFFGEDGGGVQRFKINRKNEYSANAVIQQTLFSTAVGNAIKAATQYQKLTDYVYDASYQTIISMAKKIFYQALLLEKFWQVSESAKNNAHENYLNVNKKYENGLVSEFELLQSEVRWKNAIPEEAKAKRNYELALNSLKNWAGLPISQEVKLSGDLEHFPTRPDLLEFDTILKLRPDFNALLWEAKLRRTNISAQKSGYYPSLTGSLVAAFSSQSDYWRFDQKNYTYVAGLTLNVPIFTGGYTSALVQKARVELDKTHLRIEKTKEDIYNEMANIDLRLKEAYDRILSAEATLKTAKKAFQIAETTTQSGLTTQLELKDARVGFDQAQLNYYAATFGYLSAYFDWERAVGKVEEY